MVPRILCALSLVVSLGAGSAHAQFGVTWGNRAPYSSSGHWIYGYMPSYPAPYGYYGTPTYSYSTSSYPAYSSGYAPHYPPSRYAVAGPTVRGRPTLQGAVPYADMVAYMQRQRDHDPANIVVRLPAGADLSINDQPMKQTGPERTFVTPELPSTRKAYTFELTARWNDELGPRTQRATLQVQAGRSYVVNFPGSDAATEEEQAAAAGRNPQP